MRSNHGLNPEGFLHTCSILQNACPLSIKFFPVQKDNKDNKTVLKIFRSDIALSYFIARHFPSAKQKLGPAASLGFWDHDSGDPTYRACGEQSLDIFGSCCGSCCDRNIAGLDLGALGAQDRNQVRRTLVMRFW